jgi:hypothetical protein
MFTATTVSARCRAISGHQPPRPKTARGSTGTISSRSIRLTGMLIRLPNRMPATTSVAVRESIWSLSKAVSIRSANTNGITTSKTSAAMSERQPTRT